MLVLSRKVGDEILVPDQGIVFKILEIRGEQVRVGISAPPGIRLYRREVWRRLQQDGTVVNHESGSADLPAYHR